MACRPTRSTSRSSRPGWPGGPATPTASAGSSASATRRRGRASAPARLRGQLCLRAAAPGEALPGGSGELPNGTLTIADEERPIGLLVGATGKGYGIERATRRVAVAAVQVNGVPQIAVEEALWMAASTLESA